MNGVTARKRPGRARLAAAAVGRAVGLAAVAAGAAAGGLVLHADLPRARVAIAAFVSREASRSIRGSLTIDRLGSVSLAGLGGVDATVRAPDGLVVLAISGATATFGPETLRGALALALGRGRALDVPFVRAERVDVALVPGRSGAPTLADAFSPRAPRPAASASSAPSLALAFDRVVIAHAHVAGTVAGVAEGSPGVPLDVDLDDVRGSVRVAEAVTIDAREFSLHARRLDARFLGGAPSSADAKGVASVSLAIPAPSGRALGADATFVGAVGDLHGSVGGSLDGERLTLRVDVARAEAHALRALVPSVPLEAPFAARIRAAGDPRHLDAEAHLELGDGTIDVVGPIDFVPAFHADLRVVARDLDARALAPSAPATSLSLAGGAKLSLERGHLDATFDAAFEPSVVGAYVLPPFAAKGTFAGEVLQLSGTLHEPGLDVEVPRVEVRLNEPGAPPTVEFEASADVPALDRAPRLGSPAKGRARATLHGTLAAGRLDARARVDAGGLAFGGVDAKGAALDAHLTGTLEHPIVEAAATARAVRVGGVSVDELRLRASGPVASPRVELEGRDPRLAGLTASARVEAGPRGVALSEFSASLGDARAPLAATAKTLRVGRGSVRAEALALTGFGGTLEADVVGSGDDLDVRLRGDSVALDRLARAAGLDLERLVATLARRADQVGARSPAARAWLDAFSPARVASRARVRDVDVRVTRSRGHESGSARMHLDDGDAGVLSADLDVAFEDGALVDGRTSSVRLRRGPAEFATFVVAPVGARLAGSVFAPSSWQRATGKLMLASTLRLEGATDAISEAARVVGAARGKIEARCELARESGDALPELTLRIETAGLAMTPPSSAPDASLDEPANAVAEAIAALVGAKPPRLPRWADGDAELVVSAGPGRHAHVTATLVGAGATPLATLDADGDFPIDALLRSPRSVLDAAIAARVEVPRRPIAAWPAAIGVGALRGEVEASASLGGSLGSPTLALLAQARGLAPLDLAGSLPVDVTLDFDAGADATHASVGVSHEGGGSFKAKLDAGASLASLLSPPRTPKAPSWAEAALARLESVPVTIASETHALSATVFYPFVDHVVSELGGKIEGDATIVQAIVDGATSRTLAGRAKISNARVHVPVLGQELHEGEAELVAHPESETIEIVNAEARGATGKVRANGTVTFDALAFDRATGRIWVRDDEKVPLTIEGVSLGDASGALVPEARVVMVQEPGAPPGAARRRAMLVDVGVESLHTEIPESSARDVQPLVDDPRIRIGRFVAGGDATRFVDTSSVRREAAGPEPKLPWLLTFHLADDAEVRRGKGIRIALAGDPSVWIGGAVRVAGELTIKEGTEVEILGKRFQVETGTVRFAPNEPPGNPDVAITARWDAPDGTRVYVDYAGPLRSAVPRRLRSEPQRPESELLAMLLLGSSDSGVAGANATPAGDPNMAAVGVGGSVLTMGLNQALSGVSGVDVSARVDTSVAQNPKPEVAFGIARDVSAKLGYATGLPVPGQNPDRVLVTVDWRFRNRWALSTTVGDKASTVVDMIWQYRY